MSKKRNRQGDFNGEISNDSTDSWNESSTSGTNCTHVTKALNFTKIKRSITKEGITKECSTCKKYEINEEKLKNEANSEEQPNILICLQCGHQGCGKEDEGHALEHYKKSFSDCHSMVVETTNWTVWCFQCGARVNIANRTKLQESVDFIKKSLAAKPAKMMKDQNQKEIIDIDEKEKKSTDSFPKVGGLINMGNTCFFNAVLQCLAQTPFLVKVLDDLRLPGQEFTLPGGKLKLPNSEDEVELPPIKGTLEGWDTFTSILSKVLIDMQNTDSQPYRPSELLNSFKKKNMQCMDGGQHDSHELLRHLLEIARNEDLKRYQSIILKEVGLNEKTNPEGVEDSLKCRVKFYGNQASSRLLGPEPVFRGVLVSTLECLDCGHTSHNSEPFLDLSLPVIADKPQPPILRRKNNGNEDSFDITGNVITNNTPSKHQLKKEKKAARKNRKNKRDSTSNSNDGINNCLDKLVNNEENNDMNESEESDADVEDNTETEIVIPEVGESGYSSEKQSTLPSPASPSNESIKVNEDTMKTEYPFRAREDLLKHEYSIGTSEDSLKANDYSVKTEAETMKLRESTIKRNEAALHCTELNMNNPENGPLLQTVDTNNVNANFPDAKNLEPLRCFEMTENGNNAGRILPLSSNMDDHLSLNLSLDNPSSRVTSLTLYDPNEDRSIVGGNNMLLIKDKDKEEEEDDDEEEETAYNKQWKIRRKVDSPIEINSITFGIAKMAINSNLKTCLRDAPACIDDASTRYPTKEGECSIQSCLNQFTALELMTGSNKVGCEACTKRETKVQNNNADTKMVCTPSTKQYLISKVPAVLILHLKRFQAQRVDFRKVTRHVSFPILLDLAPICKNHRKPRMYALYGVVEHSGTIHGGHYVAYVKSRLPLKPDDPRWSFLPSKYENEAATSESAEERTKEEEQEEKEEETKEATGDNSVKIEPPPGKWYYISDSRVTEVDEATVLKRQAYLLFYERIL